MLTVIYFTIFSSSVYTYIILIQSVGTAGHNIIYSSVSLLTLVVYLSGTVWSLLGPASIQCCCCRCCYSVEVVDCLGACWDQRWWWCGGRLSYYKISKLLLLLLLLLLLVSPDNGSILKVHHVPKFIYTAGPLFLFCSLP